MKMVGCYDEDWIGFLFCKIEVGFLNLIFMLILIFKFFLFDDVLVNVDGWLWMCDEFCLLVDEYFKMFESECVG